MKKKLLSWILFQIAANYLAISRAKYHWIFFFCTSHLAISTSYYIFHWGEETIFKVFYRNCRLLCAHSLLKFFSWQCWSERDENKGWKTDVKKVFFNTQKKETEDGPFSRLFLFILNKKFMHFCLLFALKGC